MSENHCAEDAVTVTSQEPADARSMALALMSSALDHLDSDSDIPSIIGARLQSAIDALWTSSSPDLSSIHLH